MIKLEREECPRELTDEVIKELTEIYIKNNEKDVWNLPKIKGPIKDALTKMTNNKCSYCECMLNIESKDVTIDHFLPKSTNNSLVVEWSNLLPSCLRCNRAKNRKEDNIINPCEVDPKEHLGIKITGVRLVAINDSIIGKNTIRVLKLNDIERVMKARLIVTEKIIEKMIDLYEDIEDMKEIKPRHINRLERYLSEALRDKEYAAVVSAKILNDDTFISLKKKFILNREWNHTLVNIEKELIDIAFSIKI